MSATLRKDRSIWIFLGELAKRVNSQQYQVVDHWDADLFAVGVAAPDESRRLVYVSTYRQEQGRYVVECEVPGEEQGYRVPSRGDGVPFDEVVAMILRHLSIVDVARSGV